MQEESKGMCNTCLYIPNPDKGLLHNFYGYI